MSLRLVRCPYCGKRFNVAGIRVGTRLKCGWCTAVLTVPSGDRLPPSRSRRALAFFVSTGLAAAIVAGVALYSVMKPEPPARTEAPRIAVASEPEPPLERSPLPFIPPTPEARHLQELTRLKGAIMDEFHTGFAFFECDASRVGPYLLAFERSAAEPPERLASEYEGHLETLTLAFRREFGSRLLMPEIEGWVPIIVLASRPSFDRYCVRKNGRRMANALKGFYERGRRRVMTYLHGGSSREVLLHEGLHHLVHYHTVRESGARPSAPISYWFQEGLATFFEGYRRNAGGVLVMDPPTAGPRLPILKKKLLEGGRRDIVSLNELLGMTVDDFWEWFERSVREDAGMAEERAALYYSESWSFVHFLHREGNPRKVLDEFFRAALAGRGSKETLERLVQEHLGKDLSQLDNEFEKFILSLR